MLLKKYLLLYYIDRRGQNRIDEIDRLIRANNNNNNNINAENSEGDSALMIATRCAYLDIMQILVSMGADINASSDSDKLTPLMSLVL